MTEADLRDVLMMRAIEREATALAPSDPLALGLAADLAWAGSEARRQVDGLAPASAADAERGSPGRPRKGRAPQDLALAWLARRASLGLGRCAQRWGTALPSGLTDAPSGLGPALAWSVPVAAFLLGSVGDVLGGSRQINLLSLPLLGLLAWNLGVYGVLAGRALWAGRPGRRAKVQPGKPAGTGLRAWLALLARRPGGLVIPGLAVGVPPAGGIAGSFIHWPRVQAGFMQDWLLASGPLQTARLTALMHAGAACLALGVLASLYARGLVLDYRAGWDSTFLDGAGVRRVLGLLLGPAAALSGQALPDAAALAGLRLVSGGSEGAARWIHLWALTLGLAVVGPRLVLAAAAWARASRLARRMPLPARADDLQRLLLCASGAPQPVWLLPYSYQLDSARQAVLAALVARRLGPQVAALVQPSLPLGSEDALSAVLPQGLPAQVLLLFALTATPERESHGAMVSALLAHLAGRCPLQVWVDESGWRQRLSGAADADRLQQRRQAWTRLLGALGQAPVFVDLGPAAAP